jgi:hypothetical protein
MTTLEASAPPILGEQDNGMPGGDGTANMRCALGEASSDSDDVIACSVREGGDGVIAGMRGRVGIGIGVDAVVELVAAAAVLAICASLASRIAATHAWADCCDSACR